MRSDLAPIVLFVYNRPWHTIQVLESLKVNILSRNSKLYIFSDGPKPNADQKEILLIEEVRKLIQQENWCGDVEIIQRHQNLGLAQSILTGVSQIISKHGKIIVLEDDIKVDPLFLSYMNEGLQTFKENKKIFHINGFNNESNLQFLLKDFYLLKFMSCWGWATWEDRWDNLITDHRKIYDTITKDSKTLSKFNYEDTLKFHYQLMDNFEGRIKTWAILWYSTIFLNNGLCLTPRNTLVENIGLDGTGINSAKTNVYTRLYPPVSNLRIKNMKKVILKEKFSSRLHLKLFYRYGKIFSLKKLLNGK